jgi:hypothetical protein
MEHYHLFTGAGLDIAGDFSRGCISKERELVSPAAADAGDHNLADADHRYRNRAGNTDSGAIIAGADSDIFPFGGISNRNCADGYSNQGIKNGIQSDFHVFVLLEHLCHFDTLAAADCRNFNRLIYRRAVVF